MDTIKSGAVAPHTNQVQALRYNSLNNELISIGLDDTLKFIELTNFTYSSDIKLGSQPRGVDVSKINGTVVVACIKQLIILKNKALSQSINITYEASSVSISKDYVAVGGNDSKVHIYDLNTFQELTTISERDFITSVRFSNDNQYLAVADNAKNVKCYRVTEGGVPQFADVTRDLWQHHAGKITNLSWSGNSKYLATSSVDTHSFIYNPNKISDYIQIKSKLSLFILLPILLKKDGNIHYLNPILI